VRAERSGWAAELVVEGDGGGEREEPAGDPGAEAVRGCGRPCRSRVRRSFSGPEDTLDPLADRCEVWSVAGFVFAARTQDSLTLMLAV